MSKTVEDICNLLDKTENFKNCFEIKSSKHKSLASSIELMDCCDIVDGFRSVYLNENNNYKIRKIAKELAFAIDRNSVEKVKELKDKYGNLKEFSKAKKLLENKAKEIWDVYNPIANIPLNALKALGITNQPDLDFLLNNSLKFFEKDNGDTTVYIISSVLNNKNMNYSIEDIHKYLLNMHIKNKCELNSNTIKYLIEKQNYTKEKLIELGAKDEKIKQALKKLPLKTRIKFMLK